MGGTLSVTSRPGQGSRFILELELPLSSQLKPPASSAYEGIIGYEGPRIPVLIVDDNPANRGVLRDMLSPLGFEITEAVNGQDALERVAAARPRLVLMDLVMPVLDGFEATRRLRRLPGHERLVIVAVSASAFEHNRADSLAVGCDDFLSKPVQMEALLKCLQHHLALAWKRRTPRGVPSSLRDQETIDAPMHWPASEVLDELKRLAAIGDIRRLMSAAEKLEHADDSLKPFASHLHRLARSFQVNNIRRFLKQGPQELPMEQVRDEPV
jgi:CheY-like chemotaxis protein